MRRCIACYTSYPQNELLRFTLHDGIVVPDTDKINDGRGVYLCKNQECYELALKKKSFNRAFRMLVDTETHAQTINELVNSSKEER